MKGFISFTDPTGKFFLGTLNLGLGLHKRLLFSRKGGKGRPLSVAVRINSQGDYPMECFVGYFRRHTKSMVVFLFKKIEPGKTIGVVGKDFDTGRFVSWACAFQEEDQNKPYI